jgi:alpha-glucosidase
VEDISWIRPGKVAWDWWNYWNISGVDFKAGINNETYKYYIDFASKKGIEYVILDEGWAVNKKADLMQVIPQIDLKGLVEYAKQKNVGLILWAGYWAFDRDMENVCRHYSEMGIKGFKVDFMDRDDQPMTDFYYRAAAMCAKYKMLIDFHGAFKPAGLNRTYPNAINFEGVAGLEQMKWADKDCDQVMYDTQIPFIRQAAGPMDYTQGAMLNSCKGRFVANYYEPMSQGTRCHQLGLYMILESPLSMLCDNPSNYLNLGGPCTDFIAQVPTVWDETRFLLGEMGEYVVSARRKGNTWYVGGITNWTSRDVTVPTDFLGEGNWKMESFLDGMNAHRRADDYAFKAGQSVKAGSAMKIHMAPGGGFALKFTK